MESAQADEIGIISEGGKRAPQTTHCVSVPAVQREENLECDWRKGRDYAKMDSIIVIAVPPASGLCALVAPQLKWQHFLARFSLSQTEKSVVMALALTPAWLSVRAPVGEMEKRPRCHVRWS